MRADRAHHRGDMSMTCRVARRRTEPGSFAGLSVPAAHGSRRVCCMQRLVIFDLDNTLLDRQGLLADWCTAFSAQYFLDEQTQGRLLEFVRERACPRPSR